MFRAVKPTVHLQIVEAGSQVAHPSLDRRDSDPKSKIQKSNTIVCWQVEYTTNLAAASHTVTFRQADLTTVRSPRTSPQ